MTEREKYLEKNELLRASGGGQIKPDARVVTTWGAVLKLEEMRIEDLGSSMRDKNRGSSWLRWTIRVSDPNAVDAGQYIGLEDVALIAWRKKPTFAQRMREANQAAEPFNKKFARKYGEK